MKPGIFFILVILLSSALADPPEVDYSTLTVDSVKDINWKDIPVEKIRDIPDDVIAKNIGKIPTNKRQHLKSSQIAKSLDQIDDLTDGFKREEVEKALGDEFGVDVSFKGAGGKIFVKGGVMVTEQGSATLTSPDYKSGSLSVNKHGRIHFIPRHGSKMNLEPKDYVFLVSLDPTSINGRFFLGNAEIKDGKLFLQAEHHPSIDGVKVQSIKAGVKVEYCFVLEKCKGQYIFTSEKKLVATWTNLNDYQISMTKDSPLFDINDDQQLFFGGNSYNVKLTIDSKGSTPVVSVSKLDQYSISAFEFVNGKMKFKFREDRINLKTILQSRKKSVAFNLKASLSNVNFGVGSKKNPLMIHFGTTNNFKVISDIDYNIITGVDCNDCNLDALETDVRAQIVQTFGRDVKIDATNPVDLNKVVKLIQKLPAGLLEEVKEIQIVPVSEIEKICFKGVAACAIGYKVIIPEGVSLSIIAHEFAHTKTYKLDLENYNSNRKAERDYYRSVEKSFFNEYEIKIRIRFLPNGVREMYSDQPMNEQVRKELQEANVQLSQKKYGNSPWLQVALQSNGQLPYGKALAEKVDGHSHSAEWEGGGSEPRFGCVRAYGCNNANEDISTHVECSLDKACWKSLTNSPNWKIHKQKFALLCKNNYVHQTTCKEMGV